MIPEEIKDKIKEYPKDRIGEAYCKLNCFEWDSIFGDSPENFDQMTDVEKHADPTFNQAWDLINERLTESDKSMYWWTIKLGKTYKQWENWWTTERKSISARRMKVK